MPREGKRSFLPTLSFAELFFCFTRKKGTLQDTRHYVCLRSTFFIDFPTESVINLFNDIANHRNPVSTDGKSQVLFIIHFISLARFQLNARFFHRCRLEVRLGQVKHRRYFLNEYTVYCLFVVWTKRWAGQLLIPRQCLVESYFAVFQRCFRALGFETYSCQFIV